MFHPLGPSTLLSPQNQDSVCKGEEVATKHICTDFDLKHINYLNNQKLNFMSFQSSFQMCLLLQYLCDCQVRHRIEAIVAFSDDFVAKLQDNQRFRYNEVMQALNMSAALTARKTKEFRSPPQEQV